MVELWVEGYRATGEWCTASCLGTFEAETIDEAVQQYLKKNPDHRPSFEKRKGVWYDWGCQIFDNEAAARASFG
jgi:hypothetical protein